MDYRSQRCQMIELRKLLALEEDAYTHALEEKTEVSYAEMLQIRLKELKKDFERLTQSILN